ncbi:MAG: hypothetical protein ABIH00_02705 [Armatimonadota bacterium]
MLDKKTKIIIIILAVILAIAVFAYIQGQSDVNKKDDSSTGTSEESSESTEDENAPFKKMVRIYKRTIGGTRSVPLAGGPIISINISNPQNAGTYVIIAKGVFEATGGSFNYGNYILPYNYIKVDGKTSTGDAVFNPANTDQPQDDGELFTATYMATIHLTEGLHTFEWIMGTEATGPDNKEYGCTANAVGKQCYMIVEFYPDKKIGADNANAKKIDILEKHMRDGKNTAVAGFNMEHDRGVYAVVYANADPNAASINNREDIIYIDNKNNEIGPTLNEFSQGSNFKRNMNQLGFTEITRVDYHNILWNNRHFKEAVINRPTMVVKLYPKDLVKEKTPIE